MTKANLNSTIDDYRGSIGKLVFKKYRGRTIVAKKPVITAEPSEAQVAQRVRFKEAAAFGKFAQNNPELRAIYEPIAQARQVTVYTVAMQDYLKKPVIKPLDLFQYKGQAGDLILIDASDEIGLVGVEVMLSSDDGALIERGDAVESAPGTGKWTYTATVPVAIGSIIFVDVVAIDHASNRTKITESLRVGMVD